MAETSATLIESAAPASTAANRWDRLSDSISPMVVKEVRQLVRGREFNYSFAFSVFVGLLVAFVTIIYNSASNDSGPIIFTALMFCMGLMGVIISPLGAFNALRHERMERTLDLVTITTMSPRRIVIGKLAAQAVKLIALFSALTPFVAMSFLLGGIDFVTIAVALTILFMGSLWACAAALFLSCLTKSRALSSFVFGGTIFFLLIILSSGRMMFYMVGSGYGSPFGPGGPFSPGLGSGSISWWWLFVAGICFCVISGANLILLAENRLLLSTEDRSTSLRIGFLIQFLFVIAFCLYPFLARIVYPIGSIFPMSQIAGPLSVFGGLHLIGIALFSVTEDLELSRRVVHQLGTASRWRRLWMFRPGGAGGAVYILALMFILLVVGAYIPISGEDFSLLLAICGYVCFFTGVPTLIVRRLKPRRIKTVQLRVGIILLLMVAALLPDFFVFLVTGKYGGAYSVRHVLDPFRTLFMWKDQSVDKLHFLSYGVCLIGFASYLLMLIPLGRQRISKRISNGAAN
jgi:hypothetical protein